MGRNKPEIPEHGELYYNRYDSLERFLGDEQMFVDESMAVQVAPGDIDLESWWVRFRDLHLCCQRTKGKLSMQLEGETGWSHCCVASTPDGAEFSWEGQSLTRHGLLLVPNGRGHLIAPAGGELMTLMVENRLLTSLGIALKPAGRKSDHYEPMYFELSEQNYQDLMDGLDRLWQVLQGPAPFFQALNREQAALIRLNVFDLLSKTLLKPQDTKELPKISRRYALVQRALSHIDATEPGQEKHLSIESLAISAGGSTRSLQRSFKDVLGITPYRYILHARINGAHQVLLDPNESRTIAEIAAAYGFCSGSEFALHYQNFFGRLPAEARVSAR
ncbi:helix-turn-helix transcriptional regulator [Paraferrimonas sedimenticola]|uniref:HTH araC/xylS-type domain-containing protein n=1 Tax=Paraferrimonas sedimenticola TaxID=375674 RepID=A0AA37RVR8_9GAMM|nr:helix-turn-helix transcriptional regulator [Paraferrimonas sedimenticola]GLP96229.1 hypothetical protein GCM10007895_15350 [Paraferrimonas sedimenticola]